MALGVEDQYTALITIALIITILSLIMDELNWKSLLLGWMSGVVWIACAFANFVIDTQNTTGLTHALTTFFVGLGIIFFLASLHNSVQMMKVKGSV